MPEHDQQLAVGPLEGVGPARGRRVGARRCDGGPGAPATWMPPRAPSSNRTVENSASAASTAVMVGALSHPVASSPATRAVAPPTRAAGR
ncbi:hypothetical protein [Streptomyces sp. NPDC050704]|uniref:hypothetical protein n=1 Tax=Streptomyces sp. NPDC050704 TaxID=3157219 RepID=UPI00341E6BC7